LKGQQEWKTGLAKKYLPSVLADREIQIGFINQRAWHPSSIDMHFLTQLVRLMLFQLTATGILIA